MRDICFVIERESKKITMDDSSSHSILSLSSLFCQETETCLNEDTFNFSNYSTSAREEENEYVQKLMNKEINVEFNNGESPHHVLDNWIKCARLNAITWILKARALFGFRFQTAYLSVTYFDRFLSNRTIDSEKHWAIRLLSMACLSLAAKMEECKVPALSEFPVEEYNFEGQVIQRMELLVLDTLKWRMISITPFAYIHHFIRKFFKDSPPKKILSRTVELVLAILRDLNLMDYRPSVIAVAAILVSLDQTMTRQTLEFKINAFFSSGLFEIEDVFDCYNRMQEIDMEKIKISNYVISPALSPNQLGQSDIIENSSVKCSVGTKRNRLTFTNTNFDQDCITRDDKRHPQSNL